MTQPEIACWNPVKRRFRGRIGRRLPFYAPLNNFGDLIGPMVVARLLERAGIAGPAPLSFEEIGTRRKLLSVGSVLHYAQDGDIVWGAGRNGKVGAEMHRFTTLDVRMVRGPLTRAFLEERGIAAPEIYGDPALLIPELFADRMQGWQRGRRGLTVVPNLNDPRPKLREGRLLDARRPIWEVLRALYESEMVVATSLHGFIMAEAFGVPARLLRSSAEAPFKYEDYLRGTGRDALPLYDSLPEALSAPAHAPPVIEAQRMIGAFPAELFS
ncbi:polysaccharide pyruvyl transferase family protein [Poseidonocella sedimentorum]|uniref:Pyruvyltransferase n=1 Tax=Poseidonocella sedimentorum TaxID=871652 RepID=A0A1I6ENW9_9RHOB|nr:polysaccharide pyruvyl transferase family protein [Poseidonocella sedimentorum]SFR19281.1 pyruvyltransferase [Poseidonocella sedimentorum]